MQYLNKIYLRLYRGAVIYLIEFISSLSLLIIILFTFSECYLKYFGPHVYGYNMSPNIN